MYSSIYRNLRLLYPGGLETRRHFEELNRLQWLSREELSAWQFGRLKKLLMHAYETVPYYHQRYKSLDIHPDDIKSFDDFQNLPYLTREDVNQNLQDLVSTHLEGDISLHKTSGSTGEPMRFYLDNDFDRRYKAAEFHYYAWYGLREVDKVAYFVYDHGSSISKNFISRLKRQIQRRQILSPDNLSESKMIEYAYRLKKWRPAILIGYPSAMAHFAKFLVKRGTTGIQPKLVVTGGEMQLSTHRKLLEDVFRCRVVNGYFSNEFGHIAYQCENDTLHLNQNCRVEIVQNGKIAPPLGMGEVVVTSLTQFSMPFIRYKNGDQGILGPENCQCGRGMSSLSEIVGRLSDFLVTPQNTIVQMHAVGRLLNSKPVIFQYQVYQPDLYNIEVRLVVKEEVSTNFLEEITAKIQEQLGPDMQISIRLLDEISPTREGKHKFVISDVKLDRSDY